jgi:hypothetical protein
MRIDDLMLQLVKGKDSVRITSSPGRQKAVSTASGTTTDLVSLSGLALLANGADPGRVEELHHQVAGQNYLVPALDVSRSIINFSLSG